MSISVEVIPVKDLKVGDVVVPTPVGGLGGAITVYSAGPNGPFVDRREVVSIDDSTEVALEHGSVAQAHQDLIADSSGLRRMVLPTGVIIEVSEDAAQQMVDAGIAGEPAAPPVDLGHRLAHRVVTFAEFSDGGQVVGSELTRKLRVGDLVSVVRGDLHELII